MATPVFRKVSIERLSSPEQLDQLIRVTSAKGWIALTAVALILATAVAWSVTGSLPEKVTAPGILIKSGGVVRVVAMSSGQLTDIRVDVGDIVKKGQVIARIAQPSMLDELRNARIELNLVENKYKDAVGEGVKKETEFKLAAIVKNKETTLESIKFAKKRIGWLEKKITSQEHLLKEGLITKQKLLGSKKELDGLREQIEKNKARIKELMAQEVEMGKVTKDDIRKKRELLETSKRKVSMLKDKVELSAKVLSPYTGKVIMLEANEGDLIAPGAPLFTVEQSGKSIKDLEAVLFVSPAEGKKLKPGMDVNISPTIVKREEHGFIRGKVTYVSEFPSTQQSMMRILNNEALVQDLSEGAAPIEGGADLVPSDQTVSGYEWSSSKGPPFKIQSGTMCVAEIIVSKRKPIELVIPYIKEKLGL